MSIALNGDGIISGVSSISNPDVTVGTGASVFSPAANTLAFGTNGSERIRIDSSGNFGIGTNNPTVFGTAYRTVQLNPASGTGDGSAIRFMYDGGTANTNDLVIYTNSAQSYIRANGARNIDVMRNGSTVATFNANGIALPSGLGIDFSAAGNAAGMTSELLDDYEEGTFTATFAGSADTTTGYYTKIGRLVHIHLYSGGINVTSSVGAVVSGLPFTIRNQYSTGAANHNTYTTNGDNFYFTTNGTAMYFYNENTIGQSTTNIGNPRYVMMSGSYTTDT